MQVATLMVLGAALSACAADLLTAEQYYSMPQLFHLDQYERCLASPGGTYCLGSFELSSQDNGELFQLIKDYSSDIDKFNHTRLYRGICVSSRCDKVGASTSKQRFERCVDNWSRKNYGLRAKLTSLEYCRRKSIPVEKPLEYFDMGLVGVVVLLILFNVMGTLYDLKFRNEKKANAALMCWSLAKNMRELMEQPQGGDPRLLALKPLQGMRVVMLALVMMVHTAFAYYITYINNPEFFEMVKQNPFIGIFFNGTGMVQTFVMVSSFLMTYNILMRAEKPSAKEKNLRSLPRVIYLRIIRIAPVNILVVWWAASWWCSMGTGPMWAPLVGSERERCRENWWAQFLFINNFVRPYERCLIQTWFLAADMQLYVMAAVLTLTFLRHPRIALVLFGVLFLLTIPANYIIGSNWNLTALLYKMRPEILRVQFAGDESFAWFYASPWGSLPASLLGLFLGFLHYHLQKIGFKPKEHKWAVMAYRLSFPLMLAWMLSGWWGQDISDPHAVALYTAIDRPLFVLCSSMLMMGTFYQIDELMWRFLSLGAWQVLAKMSLSLLMVHWCITLSYIALRPLPVFASVLEIAGSWLVVMCLSCLVSLPVYLFVEAPLHKFLKMLI